jgi:hypothetical protein
MSVFATPIGRAGTHDRDAETSLTTTRGAKIWRRSDAERRKSANERDRAALVRTR